MNHRIGEYHVMPPGHEHHPTSSLHVHNLSVSCCHPCSPVPLVVGPWHKHVSLILHYLFVNTMSCHLVWASLPHFLTWTQAQCEPLSSVFPLVTQPILMWPTHYPAYSWQEVSVSTRANTPLHLSKCKWLLSIASLPWYWHFNTSQWGVDALPGNITCFSWVFAILMYWLRLTQLRGSQDLGFGLQPLVRNRRHEIGTVYSQCTWGDTERLVWAREW